VNEALVGWLMTAPDAPDEPLTLEDWLRRPACHQRAACRSVATRTFSVAPDNLERARAVCAGCPVRDECYQFAMSDPDLMGVWAGFTAKERRELRRGRVA
jgi:WhiB family transcriptional regulator, redox-sensing transcriptional regulator